MHFGENQSFNQGVPYPLHEVIEAEVPLVKSVGQLLTYHGAVFQINDENSEEIKDNIIAGVDTNYFEVFDMEWIRGNPATSFSNKESVVLTEKAALKIFGSINVIGKSVMLNKEHLLSVTGLLKAFPAPSNFEFEAFIPIELIDKDYRANPHWRSVSSNYQNYILLDGNKGKLDKKAVEVETQLADIYLKNVDDPESGWEIKIQPLSEIHFHKEMYPNTGRNANADTLWYLFIIAIVLIFSACINYINLSTAVSILRASEIGVRKVLGSSKGLLIVQFLGETFLMVSIAIALSFCFTELFLMNISFFINWEMGESLFREALKNDIAIYLFIPGLMLLITLFSGIYPAIVTSSYNPIAAIKNKINVKGKNGLSLRRVLVLIQFSLCQLFIFGTIVVMQQLEYARNTNLGFNKEHIINIRIPENNIDKNQLLENELNSISGVSGISFSSQAPIINGWSATAVWFEKDSSHSNKMTNQILADPEYFDVYKFQFLAGKTYHESDTLEGLVVNQKFLNLMGVENPHDAIGREVFYGNDKALIISGVVSDFHLSSFRTEIKPLIIGMRKDQLRYANIKINPINQKETIAAIGSRWATLFPETTFKYNFLEDDIYKMYKSEEQTYRLFNLFAGIAIYISCLGLYGLISFISLQKRKEIGIRKVLGASVKQIVYLFSKEFILLVIAALFIAGPLGYLAMNTWLDDYAYKMTINWDVFAITLLVTMFIALITVSYQSIKSALENPAEALHAD